MYTNNKECHAIDFNAALGLIGQENDVFFKILNAERCVLIQINVL